MKQFRKLLVLPTWIFMLFLKKITREEIEMSLTRWAELATFDNRLAGFLTYVVVAIIIALLV